jgi:hypothetical protein
VHRVLSSRLTAIAFFADRKLKRIAATAVKESRPYRYPSLSHDGRRVAVGIADDIWVIDLERQSPTRLTNEDRVPALRARAGVGAPVPTGVWTPDSSRVTFSSMTSLNSYSLEWINADSATGRETLLKQNNYGSHSCRIRLDVIRCT